MGIVICAICSFRIRNDFVGIAAHSINALCANSNSHRSVWRSFQCAHNSNLSKYDIHGVSRWHDGRRKKHPPSILLFELSKCKEKSVIGMHQNARRASRIFRVNMAHIVRCAFVRQPFFCDTHFIVFSKYLPEYSIYVRFPCFYINFRIYVRSFSIVFVRWHSVLYSNWGRLSFQRMH